MTCREQLLYFIAVGDVPTDPVRIMKGLFLFTQAHGPPSFPLSEVFLFEPMSYGPCSAEVYRYIDELVVQGLVLELPVEGETWSRYAATEAGHAEMRRLEAEDASTVARRYLRELRDWTDRQSFTSLLRAVYHAHPGFAANSVLPHLRPNG